MLRGDFMDIQSVISLEDLRRILATAYEEGYHGCLDCKDGYVLELMENFLAKFVSPVASPTFVAAEDFRIYKVAELKLLPNGTFFEHSKLGYCWTIEGGMRFKQTGAVRSFAKDAFPWNQTMRKVTLS
jgi:hypothetical protein